MSTTAMPAPSEVADRAAAAVRALTDDELHAVLDSAARREVRELHACWDAVAAADPALAAALDELHEAGTEQDLPRFEALAATHERALRKAVKGSAGKFSAAAMLIAVAAGVFAASAAIAHLIGLPVFIAVAVTSAALCIASTVAANRVAAGLGTRVFADPEYAVSTVWDAAIDAAAAHALRGRAGTAGLTHDILAALGRTWSDAGLPADALAPSKAIDRAALRVV